LKRPSFQFYPGDWINDFNLSMCSLGAQGLWARLMCYMHQGEPYGHLRVNGRVITPLMVPHLVGKTSDEVTPLWNELMQWGVPEQTSDGCFYSKRMVADEEKRLEGARNGLRGGNPRLKKEQEQPPPLTHPLTHEPDKGLTQGINSSSSSSSSSDIEIQSPPKRGRTVIPYSDDFESFWGFYPRRVEKKPAFAKWNALVKKGVSPDDIITACKHYLTACKGKDEQYIKHPATFLEKDRWMEFLTPSQPATALATPPPAVIASAQTEDTLRQIQEAQLRCRAGGGG
jgi:hypothetical protein